MIGKMGREQMLAVLNSMDDQNLCKALEAAGVPSGHSGMDYEGLGDEQADGLESWNSKQVTMGDPQKPAFLDKTQFAPQPSMAQPRPQYYNKYEDMQGLEGYMPAAPEILGQNG